MGKFLRYTQFFKIAFILILFQPHTIAAVTRSQAVVRAFKATNPCPATGRVQKSCPGYVVDHILPLCGYGTDTIDNLQWQTKADAKKKDRLEIRQCNAIKSATGVCKNDRKNATGH